MTKSSVAGADLDFGDPIPGVNLGLKVGFLTFIELKNLLKTFQPMEALNSIVLKSKLLI